MRTPLRGQEQQGTTVRENRQQDSEEHSPPSRAETSEARQPLSTMYNGVHSQNEEALLEIQCQQLQDAERNTQRSDRMEGCLPPPPLPPEYARPSRETLPMHNGTQDTERVVQCPWEGCGRSFMKDNACNHVVCGRDAGGFQINMGCGRQFCFACGKKLCTRVYNPATGVRECTETDQ